MTRRKTRKSLVEDFLCSHQPAELAPAVLAQLRQHVSEGLGGATVSTRYLIDLAESAGVRVSRELGGLPLDLRDRVHFHDYTAAEASLRDMQQEYEKARAAGDRQRAQDCRRAVLRGKDRLILVLRRSSSSEKRAEKEEILSWFRVWLETPELFSSWLDLRKRALLKEKPGAAAR